jgi:hypothetical protein
MHGCTSDRYIRVCTAEPFSDFIAAVHGMRFDELSRVVQQGPARGHASHGGAVAAGWLPGWLLGAGGTASQPGGLAEDAA